MPYGLIQWNIRADLRDWYLEPVLIIGVGMDPNSSNSAILLEDIDLLKILFSEQIPTDWSAYSDVLEGLGGLT